MYYMGLTHVPIATISVRDVSLGSRGDGATRVIYMVDDYEETASCASCV